MLVFTQHWLGKIIVFMVIALFLWHAALRIFHMLHGFGVHTIQRSVQNMKLPMDWPRINQFPEWFTLTPGKEYRVIQSNTGRSSIYKAEDLGRGLNIKLSPGKLLQIEVIEL